MGNGVCVPDEAEWTGTTQEELPQPACWEQLRWCRWPAAAWAALGLRPLTGKLSGGGRGSPAAPPEQSGARGRDLPEPRGKAGLLSKDLASCFYFGWRDFWNCEMEFFLLHSESFLFFLKNKACAFLQLRQRNKDWDQVEWVTWWFSSLNHCRKTAVIFQTISHECPSLKLIILVSAPKFWTDFVF